MIKAKLEQFNKFKILNRMFKIRMRINYSNIISQIVLSRKQTKKREIKSTRISSFMNLIKYLKTSQHYLSILNQNKIVINFHNFLHNIG